MRYTQWHNPLSVPLKADLIWFDGRKRSIIWHPGETKELPSSFDTAIHIVHSGVITGGMCMQLVNVSLPESERPKLNEAFDSRLIAHQEAAAQAAAAALHARTAENLALIAAARAAEADRVKEIVAEKTAKK